MPTCHHSILSRIGCRVVAGVFATFLAASVHAQPTLLDTLARSSLARIDGAVKITGLRARVEIVRDKFGVPHIYARNTHDLFFAQGFVQAQDRLWQMEIYRRTYEGTLSEIMGPA